jgi:hypothetical protein
MSDIERPRHTLSLTHQPPFSFRPAQDPVSREEEEESDDNHTLVEVIRSNKTGTLQEEANSPNVDLLPSHPKKPRVTTRKRRASASPSKSDGTPR